MSKILAQGMITLTQLYEGAQVILTPAAVLIPCDSEENPKSNAYINASTNVKAFLGTMDITSGITLGELEYSDSTVRASKTETKVSITSITTRTGYVDIPVSATINGETIDLGKHRFSFVKQIDGQTGQPGAPGDPGFGYTLNIKGGTRGIAYAANGTNPEPNTSSQFSVELLKNGVKVSNPASISWTCGGNLNGASSVATFTPAIKSTYVSGSSYVKVSVKEFAASLAVEETIPIICTKHADGLDWINEWNNQYVQVGTEKIITPKIFAGTKNSANELTGVAIGRDVLGGNANKVIGIVGYKKNTPVFSLDQDANFFVSSSGSAGDIKNGTNNAKGLYFDGNNLYISGKVRISGGSTIGESNTLVEEVINNSNLGAQANNKVDNLSIGGRNLLTNSNKTVGETETREFVQFADMAPIIDTHGLIQYTISFDIKSKSIAQNNVISVYLQNGSGSKYSFNENVTVSEKWQRKSVTVIPTGPDNNHKQAMLAFYGLYGTGNIPIVKNVKIEKGNKATDWSPAPEDIDSALSSKANTTDVYKKTETYSKTQTESAIEVAKNEINLGVSSTYETKTNVENKISSANTTTLNSAKSYADTKKQEAISTASTDAANKVNSAKNELNTKIDGIQIGGRNYLINSDFSKAEKKSVQAKNPDLYPVSWGSYNSGISNPSTNYHAHIDNDTFGYNVIEYNESDGTRHWKAVSQGDFEQRVSTSGTFTISVDMFATGSGTKLFGGFYYYAKGGTSPNFHCGQFSIHGDNVPVNKWGRRSAQCRLGDDVDFSKNIAFYLYGYGFDSNSILYIKNVKLEFGNKATDWSQAPEDVDSAINKKANSTDVYTKSEVYTKEQTNSQINIAKEAINLGVSSTYETKANVESKVNNVSNALTSKIDGIQIGGRNLLRNSQNYSNWLEEHGTTVSTIDNSNETTKILQVTTNGSASGHVRINVSNYIRGKEYILSFYAKNISGDKTIKFEPYGGPVYSVTSTNEWVQYKVKIIPNQNWSSNTPYFYFNNKNNTSVFQIKNVKLEEGNKATDWSPAPEDVAANINAAKNEAINSANGTLTTTIANYYTKAQTDSQINVAKEAINLGVSNTYETKANVETKLNNIQIGGRNLVSDSNLGGLTSNAYGFGGRKVIGGLKNNTTYTFTVNGRSNPNGNTEGKHLRCYVYETSWEHGSWNFGISETSDTTRSLTFTTGNTIEGKDVEVAFYWFPSGGDRTGNATVNWCKVEQGNKATDWTPAPEDIQIDINNAIDNIQVGGRNLLRNTSLDGITFPYSGSDYNWRAASTNDGAGISRTKVTITDNDSFREIYGIKVVNTTSTAYNCDIAQDNVKMEDGATYTMSAYFKVISGNPTWRLQYGTSPYPVKTGTVKSGWNKCSYTFRYDKTQFSNKLTTNIYFGFVGTNFEGYICGFKLEKGNKATDWSPAPEDVYTKSQVYTREETNSQINVAKNDITLSVSNTYETKANVETKINNIRVGGRNYFLDSASFSMNSNNTGTGTSVLRTDEGDKYYRATPATGKAVSLYKGMTKSSSFKPNGTDNYIISLMVRSQKDATISLYDNANGNHGTRTDTVLKAGVWTRISTKPQPITTLSSIILISSVIDSYLDYKMAQLEGGTISSTWTPAPEDIDSAIGTKANASDVYNKTEVYTKAETNSQINVAKNEINLGVSKIEEISKITSMAKMLYTDVDFREGFNNIGLYNNLGNGTVVLSRVAKMQIVQQKSTHMVQITTSGSASPGHGGFTFNTLTRANAVFITKFLAKIPSGYSLSWYSNSTGDGGKHEWLTSTAGTGKWTEYICKVDCGASGSFSTTNYFALNGGSAPVTWYLGMATVYDLTDSNQIERRMETAEQKITKNAIISTVQETINTAKNEAINSANSSTDNKLKGYATTSSLTQTTNSIVAKFESSGGYNLLKNSKAQNGTNFWLNNGGGIGIGTHSTYGKCFKTQAPSGIKYHESIKLKNNTEYVYEGYIFSSTAIGGSGVVPLHYWCMSAANTAGQSQLTVLDYRQAVSANRWTKCYVHFRTASSGDVYFTPFVYVGGSATFDLWVTELSLSESSVESKWSPHPSEIYEGSTIIDATGVTVNNGALRVKNKSGSTVLSGDSNGNLVLAGNITSNATISGGTITGGTLKSTNGDMRFDMNNGYMLLYNNGTKIAQTNKNSISGTNIYGVSNGAEYGSYACLSAKTSSSASNYQMMVTATGSDLSAANLKKGVNLGNPFHSNNWDFKLGSSTWLCWRQNGSSYDSFITEGSDGMLRLFGDNGMYLGYRNGSNNTFVIAIRENGSHTYPKSLSVFDDGVRPATDNNGYSLEISAPLNMKGQSINQCSNIKTLGLEFIEPIAFNRDGEDKTRTLKVTKSTQNIVEFIGSAAIKNGEAIVDLPSDVSFKNYVVLLTPIGLDRKVSIVEKNDDNFKIVGDDGIVDYVIKFESMDYASYISKSISEDNTDIIVRSEEDKPKEIFIEN